MKNRQQLYEEAVLFLKNKTPLKASILYHNIFSLNLNGAFPFATREDVLDLVEFLNAME